ncbi:Anaphase-promoting complex subunit 8 [Saxophila tyrrhenica]|uniref:Anaphase-promoting complex subunit 8 n=1 Tax=Saxophila tyrrhenica TaxID=1690608 RepID=A0AAV9NX44_9PEZI|nr:Anaphase-promoting complex subunit 8 [Saxophila tyrrhenica]
MSLNPEQQAQLQAKLQQAVIDCSERCLYFSAKWAAELSNSFAPTTSEPADDTSDTDIDDDTEIPSSTTRTNHDRKEARLEERELSRYLMAKSFFDCREYDRCAAVFLPNNVPHGRPAPGNASATKLPATGSGRPSMPLSVKPPQSQAAMLPKRISQKSLFLGLYARYMSGEKRKNEDSETVLGPADGPVTPNKEIDGILAVLEEYFTARGGLDNYGNSQGWLEYLYGLLLLKSKTERLATQWLVRSVNINFYNWSAWIELGSLVGSQEELQIICERLPQNVMTLLFYVNCCQELFLQTEGAYNTLSQMQAIFPKSAWLAQQSATLHYHANDHETALQIFDNLLTSHPQRLDGMDIFSNLLFVVPSRPKLATLAATASAIDKFRPETNIILGNYYSLISEHEKAVLHFRRALTLDRNFQAAWTLMGHEYVELKNTQAAIESYRRAVDINRKDFRAWYGLGQGYEMLECWSYSLYYFHRAAAICPHDPKMWAAVGNAYAKCGKLGNAIQALKRALGVGSQIDPGSSFGTNTSDPLANAVGGALDPQILYDIALLYERSARENEASAFMELCLAQEEGAEEGDEGIGVTQITSRARLWLAKWCHQRGDWKRTMEYANELCQDGVEVEEAKGLVRDVRARLAVQEIEEED